ncbi:acyltransferase family protein [Alteromonas sp. a30]|uniref:acyltransferase family protein n=1 Tax=Alteromonas sp. a30 TaxID=2730917 RepID=UPI00227EC977|nr:acyltransferase family protein [Alteromonas sp. a30]MCY7294358.1 acyltransferase [Alteromonas sp. a30]
MLKYRPEIDGLRTIAVMSVILFHAGFEFISGGFLGVDVFFVISGFLITSLILQELEEGRFSLFNFYERRVRRIAPALAVVLLVSVPFAWWLLSEDQLINYSQSLVATTFFASNVLFWLESGYFDTAAELKPLLHTWSLAVEEQYYVIFPLLLSLFSAKKAWRILGLISFLLIVSLIAANHYSASYHSLTFFLLPFRAWELLIGALLASLMFYQHLPKLSVAWHNLLSLIGLFAIVGSILLFGEHTPTPSFYTLIPTVGTALIILSAVNGTLVNTLLRRVPFVLIGKLSYSLYLWHQPVFALAKAYSLRALTNIDYLVLILVVFLLSAVTYQFVEQPFRNRQKVSSPRLLVFYVLTSIATVAIGLYGHFNVKVADRLQLQQEVLQLPSAFMGIEHRGRNCSFPSIKEDDVCVLAGKKVEPRSLFILGDSQSRVLSGALWQDKTLYSELVDLSASGCPFLLDLSIYEGAAQNPQCTPEYQQLRLDFIKQFESEYKVVVVSAHWLHYGYDDAVDNGVGGISAERHIKAATGLNQSSEQVRANFKTALANSIKKLTQVADRVVLVYPSYSNGWSPVERARKLVRLYPEKHATSKALFNALAIPQAAINQQTADFEQFVESSLSTYSNLTLINSKQITCRPDSDVCIAGEDGQFLFTDELHLSAAGNQKLVKVIAKRLAE